MIIKGNDFGSKTSKEIVNKFLKDIGNKRVKEEFLVSVVVRLFDNKKSKFFVGRTKMKEVDKG